MNPSVNPATTSHGIVPNTIATQRRASAPSDAVRVRRPGSTIDQPRRSPAAPATVMHESSSTPCATTSSKNTRPLPDPMARPATVPSSTPFVIRSAAVPSPSSMPPANARNVTSMLFVKIWLETAARSEEDNPSSEPWGRGSVTER